MIQYLNLLEEVYTKGYEKKPARKGLPSTRELFCRTMAFDLQEGFPLLTCRKMYIRGFVEELLWLLRGQTGIKYLAEKNVNIWNDDAYRFYRMRGGLMPKEQWLEMAKAGFWDAETKMDFGELGRIYGYQWRNFAGQYDQIARLIKGLKRNPDSRRHIVSAWNPVDYAPENGYTALPACHILFQCNVRDNTYLDLMMLQRSCDMMLGVPFDIAEYALLCHILAQQLDLKPGVFTWVGNSCHIYATHFEMAEELISRKDKLLPLCKLEIRRKPDNIEDYKLLDFEFSDYNSLPKVKIPLCVGV